MAKVTINTGDDDVLKDPLAEKWEVDGPKTIEFDGIRTLRVGIIAGQVDIIAHDEPVTRVEVHGVERKAIQIARSGGKLSIGYPSLQWSGILDVVLSAGRTPKVDLSVLVPRDVAATLSVVSADALISGLQEDVRVNSVSGDIVVDGVAGDLSSNSVSGELIVRSHYGEIDAHTVSGDVTVSGEILRLRADGVSGDVFVDSSGVPDQIKVNTVSGSVTARLSPDTPTSYSVQTVGGRVSLDGADVTVIKGGVRARYGTLERRYTDFTANTVGGSVTVLRERASA